MALYIRIGALITVLSSLLVITCIVMGRMSSSIILVNSQEIEGQVRILFVEDLTQDIHISVAGTRCPLPHSTWDYPNRDSALTPAGYYRRSFLSRITEPRELFPLCDPFLPSGVRGQEKFRKHS